MDTGFDSDNWSYSIIRRPGIRCFIRPLFSPKLQGIPNTTRTSKRIRVDPAWIHPAPQCFEPNTVKQVFLSFGCLIDSLVIDELATALALHLAHLTHQVTVRLAELRPLLTQNRFALSPELFAS